MLEPVKEKDKGWQEWLKRWDIYDENSDQNTMYLRYMKLKDFTFPLMPKEHWSGLFKDLVSLESGLVFGDAIGKCTILPFSFKVTNDDPVRNKPIMYPKKERQWINEHMRKLVELGVVKELKRGVDPDPRFICNVVLVKDGQSQQDFRLCGNFIPINGKIESPAHPMVDCRATIDNLQGNCCFSTIDAKAGFLNIVVPENLQTYLGVITQDHLYQYLRMPFGTSASACHFQSAMMHILRDLLHSTYLDDCTIGNNDPQENWKQTMTAMTRLINAGIPINIKKCKFLVPKLKLLGYMLSSDGYQVGKKSISKLLGGELPQNRQQLQKLLGQLNFASTFIPRFRQKVQPIVSLLNKSSDGKWTEEHTRLLNEITELILKRCKLGIVDTANPVTIYIDEHQSYFNSMLTQGDEDKLTICDFATRELLTSETQAPRIERLLLGAIWAINKFSRYTYNSPQIYISLPHQSEMLLATCGTTLSPRLQMKLIELSSFKCKFKHSYSATAFMDELARLGDDPPEEEEENSIPNKVWIHKDIIIPPITAVEGKSLPLPSEYYTLQFDGGCQNKLGAGGSVLWDQDKKLISGRYFYYGSTRTTNNKSEAQSLVDALTWSFQQPIPTSIQVLLVQGDSSLIIQFMQGINKPGEQLLQKLIHQCREMVIQNKHIQVQFQHIPRQDNFWADLLCRVAYLRTGDGIVNLPEVSIDDRDIKVGSNLVAYWGHEEQGGNHSCKICDKPTEELQCWGCGLYVHYLCLTAATYPTRRGPWHCESCRSRFKFLATRDITLDEQVLNYLSHEELPEGQMASARVTRTTKYVTMDQRGDLWCTGIQSGPPRKIPPIYQRHKVILSCLATLNSPNGHIVYAVLKNHYFWTGMSQDCKAIAASLTHRQKSKAKFKPPPYLLPPSKGCHPFALWAVDCLVNLSPPSPHGATTILLAIDPFTKWIELGVLDHLNSHETAVWFHNNIVCRYGTPYAVKSDRGVEFQGRFHRYLELAGIQHRYICTMNPRANGQAERGVRMIKEGITRCVASCPGAKWWEVLGDVLRGLRLSPSRATKFSPYQLVYKQQPSVPFVHSIDTYGVVQEDFEESEFELLMETWDKQFKEVVLNQLKYDKQMVQQYHKRRDLASADVRFVFDPGDPVLLRAKEPGKLKCRAVGPYIFTKYIPPGGLVAEIKNAKGKIYKVSSSNLLPMRSEGATKLLKLQPDWDIDEKEPLIPQRSSHSNSSSDITISSSDEKLPPGVRIIPEQSTR